MFDHQQSRRVTTARISCASLRRAVAAGAVATTATVVAFSSPAQAHTYTPYNGVCDYGELCVYSQTYYRGSMKDFPGCFNDDNYFGDRYVTPLSGYLNNDVRSIWNRSGYVYEFYTFGHYRGQSLWLYTSQANLDKPFDEELSSHRCIGS